jgi:hypothetical protein
MEEGLWNVGNGRGVMECWKNGGGMMEDGGWEMEEYLTQIYKIPCAKRTAN